MAQIFTEICDRCGKQRTEKDIAETKFKMRQTFNDDGSLLQLVDMCQPCVEIFDQLEEKHNEITRRELRKYVLERPK